MNTLRLSLITLAATVAILNCKAAKPRDGQMITVQGQVSCSDGDPNAAYVLLFVDECLVDSASVDRDGGFVADLPVNIVYTLEVHKPGFTTKRVEMDTRNALANPAYARWNRDLNVEILLFPRPAGEAADHCAPAGRFSFDGTTGELKVEHELASAI